MTDTVKTVLAIFAIAFILNVLAKWLNSNFLEKFLGENIILILITLLAINITTVSIIMTKLKEIVDRFGGSFPGTVKQMKISIKEQIILITLAVMILLLNESLVIRNYLKDDHDFIMNIILTGIFIYAIDILRDTAKTVFDILQFDQKADPKH